MNKRFQNLRMVILALLLFLIPVTAAYTGAYFYLGSRVEVFRVNGRVMEKVRFFPHEKLARFFVPMGHLESHFTQRCIVVTGPPRLQHSLKQISISMHQFNVAPPAKP